MRFDPTPPAPEGAATALGLFLDSMKMNWYRYVVGYDTADQRALLGTVTAPAFELPGVAGVKLNVRPIYLIALATVLLLLTVRLFLRGLPERRTFETRAYLKLRRAVKKKGGNVQPSSAPGEVLAEARRLSMDAEGAAELIRFYEGARFGGRELDGEAMKRCRELVAMATSKR
jgi:hypothetical protein